jgi:hypothetical protein
MPSVISAGNNLSTFNFAGAGDGILQISAGSPSVSAAIVASSGNIVVTTTTPSTSATTGAFIVSGGAAVTGNLYIGSSAGNSIVATGNINVAGNLLPFAGNSVYNIGSTVQWFNTFYGVSTQAQYADLAENYQADQYYNPGTVLMFGGADEVTIASADTTAVAGIVSANPAHLMNGSLSGATVVPVALIGRVFCNVIGPIAKGDLLVSAGFGYARTNNNPRVGSILGKALQDFPNATKGIIEVVVGRL